MNRLLAKHWSRLALATVLSLVSMTATLAQQPPEPLDEETQIRIEPMGTARVSDELSRETSLTTFTSDFWPALDGPALTWFAVVVILVLSFRTKPLLCERNLDALILAATCLLLALREDRTLLPAWIGGQSTQWGVYLLLAIVAGYWLLRGLCCCTSRTIIGRASTVSTGALFVLMLAGLAVGIGRISTEPLSAGARDALAGGLCLSETGRLPYGDVGIHDSRSPLLYLTYAGATKVVSPTTLLDESDTPLNMSWENRNQWLGQSWWNEGDFAPARLVNGLLFILMLLGLYTLGHRLHTPEIGLTMTAIFCVFPGAVECFGRPEIMLPAVLTTWSLALALLPAVGGLLAAILLVLAGVAWPWAWLGIPVLLAYMFRNGLQSLGAVVGTLGGIAAILAGLTWLIQPTVPRTDGALQRAGLPPGYQIDRSEHGILVVSERAEDAGVTDGWLGGFWKFMVNSENLALDVNATGPGQGRVSYDDIDPRKLIFNQLDLTEDAREEITTRYRLALAGEPNITRMWVALRTTLEQTWLVGGPAPAGTWALWSGAGDWGPFIRKLAKLIVGLMSLAVGLLVYMRGPARPHYLIGGLLAVFSACLLVSQIGAINNLVWLLPLILALWAVHEEPPAKQESTEQAPVDLSGLESPAFPGGPAPRITVE
ncbi:MAG: hypothetical protein ABIG44_13825 [Planctomycetota bacterium]